MGIQINGQTDTVSSTTSGGKVTITPFNGNVGTGASISSPATNVLTLGINNTESVRINSTGVGIGTNNPASTLDVGGEITIRRTNASSEGGQINFARASDNTVAWNIDAYGSTSTPSIRFVDSIAAVTRMEIDGSGRVTMPYQPLAVVGKTNGTSSVGTIVFEKVWHNVGSHYDNSTGVFTCPVAGYYYTHIMVMSSNSNTTMDIALQVNGSGTHQLVPYQAETGGAYNQVSGSTIIYCAANDNLRYSLNSGSIYGGGGSAGRHSSVIFHLVG